MSCIEHLRKRERVLICGKNNAYACLKSGCQYAEAADGQFICHAPENIQRERREMMGRKKKEQPIEEKKPLEKKPKSEKA